MGRWERRKSHHIDTYRKYAQEAQAYGIAYESYQYGFTVKARLQVKSTAALTAEHDALAFRDRANLIDP